ALPRHRLPRPSLVIDPIRQWSSQSFLYVFRDIGYNEKVTRALALILAVAVLFPLLPVAALAQTTEADVYVAQGVLDFDEKRYDDATANFRKALELEPDHVEALHYLGVVN